MLRKFPPRGMALAAGVISIMSASVAWAGPAQTLYTPIVSYREWELEWRGGSQDWAQRDNGEQAMVAAVGYGITRRWSTEVAAEYSRTPGKAPRVEEFEWENVIQLTEHGRYWMDVGLFAEYAHNRLKGTDKIVMGPMFQKEVGRSQFNLNILFDRRVDKRRADEAPIATRISYALQWRWHGSQALLSPGLQGFGSFGSTSRLHSETLNLGPAMFGEARLGGGRKLKYNAAVLAGVTGATADLTARFQLEYEFF